MKLLQAIILLIYILVKALYGYLLSFDIVLPQLLNKEDLAKSEYTHLFLLARKLPKNLQTHIKLALSISRRLDIFLQVYNQKFEIQSVVFTTKSSIYDTCDIQLVNYFL